MAFLATAWVQVASAVDFVHEVMPILKEHCAECHTGAKKKGGLAINNREQFLAGSENGEILTLGDGSKSFFIQLMESKDDGEWMPPKGDRVPPEQIAVLKKWVDEGLPWEPGISLGESSWEPPLKPRKVDLPPAQAGRTHPIDRILDHGLARDKKPTPPPTSDAAFLRRIHLDLIGLLPTPEQTKAFVAESDPAKREKEIDRLLAMDVAYADHWLTTWNDLLRNDYTGTGFITKGRTQITTWLYQALRENKPYDVFVRELIAPPNNDSSGFINGIKWRGDVNASQTLDMQFAQNISQVFLGLNIKCASCHDSFVDRWTLEEAYNLAAIYAGKPLELHRCDVPTGKMATPKWIFPEIGDIDPAAPKEERLNQLAGLMTHPENGRFSRTLVNRIWERLMGRGIVHPVDAMDTKPWNEDLLDYVAIRFAEDGYDLRKFIRFVTTSQAYQSESALQPSKPGEDYVYEGPLAKRMTAEQFLDTIWQVTGTFPTKGTAKVDRTLSLPSDSPPSKIKPTPIKASWIWHAGETGTKSQIRRKFTLTKKLEAARLIATCDNAFVLKINGKEVAKSDNWQKPLYLDVADALKKGENLIEVDARMTGGAAAFIAELVMVQDGKQTSLFTDANWEARPPGDTEAKWNAAAVIQPHGAQPWGAILKPNQATVKPTGPQPPLRAALLTNDFLMRSLGRPHREQVVTTRPAELTTLQAIDLANGDILAGYLSKGGQKLAASGRSGPELVDWAFLHALGRAPTEKERPVLLDVVGDGTNAVAVEDLLWLIFMQPDFQILR